MIESDAVHANRTPSTMPPPVPNERKSGSSTLAWRVSEQEEHRCHVMVSAVAFRRRGGRYTSCALSQKLPLRRHAVSFQSESKPAALDLLAGGAGWRAPPDFRGAAHGRLMAVRLCVSCEPLLSLAQAPKARPARVFCSSLLLPQSSVRRALCMHVMFQPCSHLRRRNRSRTTTCSRS